MIPCIYDSKQHEIFGHEIIGWCRRQMEHDPKERDRLFLYHHRIHETLVIARWADKPFGIFTDFLNFGYSTLEFTRAKAMEFRRRMFAPLSAMDMAKALGQGERDHNSEQTEKGEELKDEMARDDYAT